MGTGDSNFSPDVSEASAIRRLIIEKKKGAMGSKIDLLLNRKKRDTMVDK